MEKVKSILTHKFNIFLNNNDIKVDSTNIKIHIDSLCDKNLPTCDICQKEVKFIFKSVNLVHILYEIVDLDFIFTNTNSIMCGDCQKLKRKPSRKRKRVSFYGLKCDRHNIILSEVRRRCYMCTMERRYGMMAKDLNRCCLENLCNSHQEVKVPRHNLLVCNSDKCIEKMESGIYRIEESSLIAYNTFKNNVMLMIKCFNFYCISLISEIYRIEGNKCFNCKNSVPIDNLRYYDQHILCDKCHH